MDLYENRDDDMETESSEEDTAINTQKMLDSKAGFEETWKMLDNFAAFISEDKKQNYANLKDTFRNFIKHAEKRDAAINELNIAKLKLEDLEQEKKNNKEEIENLRKKIEEQNDELSKGVEFRHDALGEKKFFIYMSKCSLLKELREKYKKKCEKKFSIYHVKFL